MRSSSSSSSSSLLTVQGGFGQAVDGVVSYVSDLGDEHKLHQPGQPSALVDHLRRLAVAQAVGDDPQGVDVEVVEFLVKKDKCKITDFEKDRYL